MTADQPYQLLPPLDEERYAALREDIAVAGIRVPIDVDEHGVILNGHHRKAIADELGIDCPVRVVAGLTDEEKRAHALATNTQGRHLTREQRRALIAAELAHDPSRSDRAIGRLLAVDHKTVAAVRRGEIPHPSPFTAEQVREAEELTEQIRKGLMHADQMLIAAVVKYKISPAFVARQLQEQRARYRDEFMEVFGDDFAVTDEMLWCTRLDWLAGIQAMWCPEWRFAEEADLVWLQAWADARPAQHRAEVALWREAAATS